MIRYVFILLLVVISFAITADAQTDGAKNRSKLQPTRFQRQHMTQTLEMHINLLTDKNPSIRAMAIQNIRDMEFAYPNESFSDLLAPLMKRIMDENETTQVRLLSAMAIDGLHSDKGDQAIEEVSNTTSNQMIKELCTALLVKSQK
jgi:hypothetical protein